MIYYARRKSTVSILRKLYFCYIENTFIRSALARIASASEEFKLRRQKFIGESDASGILEESDDSYEKSDDSDIVWESDDSYPFWLIDDSDDESSDSN